MSPAGVPEGIDAVEDVPVDPWEGRAELPGFFGEGWAAVSAFHSMLVTDGVLRGLVGPREVSRLWERHLINSLAPVPFLPTSGRVIDVGSGAGFPGVILAAVMPQVEFVLLEPMERRAAWLTEVVAATGLTNVEVQRGRAEELAGRLVADGVTARAVAPLDRLYGWTLPLLRAGGVLVALKGGKAAEEIVAGAGVARSLGASPARLELVEPAPGAEATAVVVVTRELVTPLPAAKRAAAKAAEAEGDPRRSVKRRRSGRQR